MKSAQNYGMECQWAPTDQQELQAVLDIEKVDVCLISETHFTKQSYIKFRGYKVYHTIHLETPLGEEALS